MAGIFGIEELIKTDKIIVIFGTGKFSARLSNLFRLLGIKIAYFLDNNESVWNQTFFGAKVFNPEALKEECVQNTIVIVASTFYADISNQLMEYGFEENKDFFNGEAIMYDAYAHIERSLDLKAIMDYMADRSIFLYGADKVPGDLIPMLNFLGLDARHCKEEDTAALIGEVLCPLADRPDNLGAEGKDVYILVFSDKYYEIINAMLDHGYSEFYDYYNGYTLYNILFGDQGILKFILKGYSEKNKECFFVQIGANDGVRHDPLREFVLNNNWKGILVEPVKYIFKKLTSNYSDKKGLIFENVAISDKDEWRDFYYFNEESDNDLEGDYPEYGTFIYEQIEEWLAMNNKSKKYLVKEKVLCMTIDSLLKRNNIQKFDVLCIDVEGYDYEIVKSLDFNFYNPDIIIYEINHLTEEDRKESFYLLEKHGYKVLGIGIDAVAIRAQYMKTYRIR
ncbi:MAG TPA: FkbM family methyltransferase [Bacillota bacterium]|nr:FkbM family methyltransferase [Bacillota bacterium]HRS20199.1 FkbM family methyltransferase [Clostridia bacterium]